MRLSTLLLLTLPAALPSDAGTDAVADICAGFESYDQDGDGQVEIACVEPLFAAGEEGSRVVVLVEDRLARPVEGEEDLAPRIERLVREGERRRRAKVFYDEPKGFAAALAEGESFGAAWARYFEIESQAETWGQAGGDIGRKRAYFWSVLGDWTLQLSTGAPGH